MMCLRLTVSTDRAIFRICSRSESRPIAFVGTLVGADAFAKGIAGESDAGEDVILDDR